MKMIVDTHAHLCDEVFDRDLPRVLARARAAGISSVIAVSETMKDAGKNLQLAERCPMIRPAAGLYPTCLDPDAADEMISFIRKNSERLVAIGEVGLDYWKVQEEAARERQREIFKRFIRLSRELDMPLNVHSRSAGRHVVELLLEMEASKVQLHAFDGKASTALPAAEAGFYFSVPPSIVRSSQKQKLAKKLPLSRLLIETDSPVLGSVPEERNEPAHAIIAVKAIAE
ncbi:MAG TPA: TatD family hydrolase, partial [Acidobacteriota bacterium]|nr:TatD family hydrolase [Acidobacteriota bacterium]